MKTRLLLVLLAMSGCMWSDFDDLSETTWVRSTFEPDIGSRNYAVSILGVTTATSGGQLGVVSDDTPDFSTLDYDAKGNDKVGGNDVKLGQHRIAVLSDPPVFATDGTGKIAIAERSTTGGAISVVFGSASAPAGLEFMAATAVPDSVVFTGADIVVAAGNTLYTLQTAMQVPCMNSDAQFRAIAMASDGTNLWVWSSAGKFFSIPISALAPCNGGMLPASGTTFDSMPFLPASGARIHLVGTYAILTAHTPMSRMGQVFVVDTTTLAQVDTMLVEGIRASALAQFGGMTYLAVGVPDRAVDGVVAGQVDLFSFDTATGKLNPTSALVLHDAQPEGQQFGRSVTTMKFNNQDILVVAAKSEVFAYYKTALYDVLP